MSGRTQSGEGDRAGDRKPRPRNQRYPPVEKDDSVHRAKPVAGERRSFKGGEAKGGEPDFADEGLLGPRGDPAEGKP